MRLEDVNVDTSSKKMEIDIEGNKPFCVVYCNGKARKTYLPDHGETKVITHQGRVKRLKFDEGEEF
ncbi:hypothetical protein SAMN05421676_102341 [Salinibacillus kushneri]|uniref:Uncharacterized protein n=2 Tax=Salinibacillus kushneri TaxID=237682 RepID=A0A1I0B3N6_9BACI|nr:XtrA/YqaO family protein [Salinibacillus kushneri]SET01294.1 hypothetical protein SAMN05421676_102341 [Salinibacillus kushneri]